MTRGIYAADKIVFHPEALASIRSRMTHMMYPIFVMLMPQNQCNQSCSFCSYRMKGWHNSAEFNEKACIPWEKMEEILFDLDFMGVKAVELQGGGEPTIYPHFMKMMAKLGAMNIQTSIVTNGVHLTEDVVDAIYDTDFVWGRVSIDAATLESYVSVRRCPDNHFKKALEGMKRLADRKANQSIGMGFVVTDTNWREVYDAVNLAQDWGADNIRISVARTAKGKGILQFSEWAGLRNLIEEAEADHGIWIGIHDFTEERKEGSVVQNYDYCHSKDFTCVIEGEQKVYSCCTLTGDPRGLMGSLENMSFRKLWRNTRAWRRELCPSDTCNLPCFYERKNKNMLRIRDGHPHENFL